MKAAQGYLDGSRAASTRTKCERDWQAFPTWSQPCDCRHLLADPSLVAVHLSALADSGLAPMAIGKKFAAIGYTHGYADPQRPDVLALGQPPDDPLDDRRPRPSLGERLSSFPQVRTRIFKHSD